MNEVVSCLICGNATTAHAAICNDCMYQDEVTLHFKKDELDLAIEEDVAEEEREEEQYWNLAEAQKRD